MRKLLLLTTALVSLAVVPSKAEAAPVAAIIAGWVGAGAFGTAVITALTQLAGSLILSAVARSLQSKPKAEQVRAELARPSSLPAYRFIYGSGWAPGTPVGWVVRGSWLYICYLLNSRPSALTAHTVLLDKRAVVASGDPFDFEGSGAMATNGLFDEYFHYWLGRGDQTTCPDEIVSETNYFEASDAWQGCTVLWAKIHSGRSDKRQERWPATPPALNVEGDWSLVHDPRTNTTGPSRNQALIVRDALMSNPIRPYGSGYLWDETFAWAADVADELVTNKDASQTPRYRCDGVLVWGQGAELEDQIEPLLAAGGARLIRVGGKLGIVPAVARDPVLTISDVTDGQPLELTRWQPGDDLYTECVASYTAPDRAYESAETPAYVVSGAQVADGGLAKRLDLQLDFVTDHRQAQRLSKIAVLRSRMQRAISCETFPDAFELVAGSIATVSLPWPYTAWSGTYEVEQINPAAGLNDDDTITIRLPISLRETSAQIYQWDAATEEQFVEVESFDPWISSLDPPSNLILTTGGDAALIDEDGTITPRVGVQWSRSNSASATRYIWEWKTQFYRRTGGSEGTAEWVWEGSWREGGTVDPASGHGLTISVWIDPVNVNRKYRARVRAIGAYGESDWIESADITATAPSRVITPPSILLTVGGSGKVDLTLRQVNDTKADRLDLYVGDVDDINLAAPLVTISAGANVTVSYSHSGLGPATTKYYWLRARDALGSASAFTASVTATTL